MRKAELAYMHGVKSLDAAHLTTRVKNETEYAVHPGEDLKDALLQYYVDKMIPPKNSKKKFLVLWKMGYLD